MTVLNYDAEGNPIPYSIIPLDLSEFHFNLVANFSTSHTRAIIFDGYQNYCKDIVRVVKDDIEHWIDGSFTTTKENPNDIDLVNCIHVEVLDVIKEGIEPFLTSSGDTKSKYHVDGYLLPLTDPSDVRYPYFYKKYQYWKNWFGYDRNKNRKGIISIKVSDK